LGAPLFGLILFLAALMLMPLAAQATSTLTVIDVGDSTTTPGTNWSYASGVFTITGDVAITGTTTTNRVIVDSGAPASITLQGASIDTSGTPGACAFDMTGATVALRLRGVSTLTSGDGCAGLEAPAGTPPAVLTIIDDDGTGELNATGGSHSAGIGGGSLQDGGNITINSGTVTATGDGYGAGIGGGASGAGGTIDISGGKVTATGGDGFDPNATPPNNGGAGIGGGSGGGAGNITISGSADVTATGGGGAGIGAGYYDVGAVGGTVTITGTPTVMADNSGTYGAGIGGGDVTVTIEGGDVTAIGGGDGAGIGGDYQTVVAAVIIRGGKVTATGGPSDRVGAGAGIGGGGGGASGNILIYGNTTQVTATTGGAPALDIGVGQGGTGGNVFVALTPSNLLNNAAVQIGNLVAFTATPPSSNTMTAAPPGLTSAPIDLITTGLDTTDTSLSIITTYTTASDVHFALTGYAVPFPQDDLTTPGSKSVPFVGGAYPISFSNGFSISSVDANGITATGEIAIRTATGVASQPSVAINGDTIEVTITLAGNASAEGLQIVGLTSATLGNLGVLITPPTTPPTPTLPPAEVTRTVAVNELMTASDTFTFTFTMPANPVTDLEVIHSFTKPTLTIVPNTGGGSVSEFMAIPSTTPPTPAQIINCTNVSVGTANCTGTYEMRTTVILTVLPDPGYTFAGWGGDCNPNPATGPNMSYTAEVLMDAIRNCTATFQQTSPLPPPAPHTLIVIPGSGGSVSETLPAASTAFAKIVNCTVNGGICAGIYDTSTLVILTATPDPGYTFVGWTGDCTGFNAAPQVATVVIGAQDATCAAAFTTGATLTVSVNSIGSGSGSVSDDQSKIAACTASGGSCTGAYAIGTVVTLSATPAAGSDFAGWGGDCAAAVTSPTVTVTMGVDRGCVATFTSQRNVHTLIVGVNGGGSVSDGETPPQITACTATGGGCAGSYAAGTVVTLTATAAAGYTFSGWAGACSGTAPTTTVTMNGDYTCAATFTSANAFTLSVSVIGNGGVSETATNPSMTVAQISNCSASGGRCSGYYNPGTEVTLTATEVAGYTFSGWSGACAASAVSVATVTMDADHNCIALFTPSSGPIQPSPPPPPPLLTPRQITGDWYDPVYNGSGFNITQTTEGLLLFYYGWDNAGNRLWLISDIGPKQISAGTSIVLNMNQTNDGHFLTPASPDTLTVWGKLSITFGADGSTASASLSGKDGTAGLSLTKLAGIVDAPLVTGDWYDPAYNGSGFNILASPNGLILFYYGWDNDGHRLWLISDITAAQIAARSSVTMNRNVTTNAMKDASFLKPADPITSLSHWGTLQLDFSSCIQATGTLASEDGSSTVTYDNLQMLIGVLGMPPGC
jgi:uncharacterized repeat protein (TIGR02543 family)